MTNSLTNFDEMLAYVEQANLKHFKLDQLALLNREIVLVENNIKDRLDQTFRLQLTPEHQYGAANESDVLCWGELELVTLLKHNKFDIYNMRRSDQMLSFCIYFPIDLQPSAFEQYIVNFLRSIKDAKVSMVYPLELMRNDYRL